MTTNNDFGAAPEVAGTMRLIEGPLTDINVDIGRENLLQRIEARYRGKSVATGTAAAVGDMFGQAAAAASLAMYDGEDTQNFICLIDGQVMCGQFGGAEWLKDGNRVRAVVTRHGDVWVAHAILDETQGLVWVGHAWGSRAEAKANWTIAWWCYVFGNVCMAISGYLLIGWSAKTFEAIQISLIGGAAICFGVALWANRDMRSLADPSTEIFRLLGFSNPEDVNLNNHQVWLVASRDFSRAAQADHAAVRPAVLDMSECQRRNVFDYKRAIADGKLALKNRGPRST